MAATQVEVMGEAEQEIQQETEQEAAKVQKEQETTSGNIQKIGETREDNTKPTVVTKGGGTLFKRSLSVAGKGKREL